MDDEAAFLAAISASPQDDAPKLVYADWLEERDDERGELIRHQVQMAKLPAYDDEYQQLKPRRNLLRDRADPKWVEAMGFESVHRPLFDRLPLGREERWRLVEEFIETWHPAQKGDSRFAESNVLEAEARLGRSLPVVLREWYSIVAKLGNVWTSQDHLVEPLQLCLEPQHDALVIRYENQSCEWWGIRAADLDLPDPPIVELLAGIESSQSTGAFAILTMLFETSLGNSKVRAWGELPDEMMIRFLDAKFVKAELPSRYWVGSPLGIFEGIDIVIQTSADAWLYVGARNEAALAQIDREIMGYLETDVLS